MGEAFESSMKAARSREIWYAKKHLRKFGAYQTIALSCYIMETLFLEVMA